MPKLPPLSHEEQQHWLKVRNRLMALEGKIELERPYKRPRPKQNTHKQHHPINGGVLLRELYGL